MEEKLRITSKLLPSTTQKVVASHKDFSPMPQLFQVDAFTSDLFKGNPAAVCPLNTWPDDTTLQHIARENNLSETAFFMREHDGYRLRWFTPTVEVDLCGHATLATAHVLWNHLDYAQDEIRFFSNSGELLVRRNGDSISMSFPNDELFEYKDDSHDVAYSIGLEPDEIYRGKYDLLCVYKEKNDILCITPDFHRLKRLEVRGVIITAPGSDADFVSRFFAPQSGINEDPVTGSAHTTLTAYWSKKLGKTQLHAQQLSNRGGQIDCELLGNRVELTGKARTYLIGEYYLD